MSLPVPVVWSLDGPVDELDVLPLCNSQSKLSAPLWSFVYVHNPVSKLQFPKFNNKKSGDIKNKQMSFIILWKTEKKVFSDKKKKKEEEISWSEVNFHL